MLGAAGVGSLQPREATAGRVGQGSSKGPACLSCLREMHKSQLLYWGELPGSPSEEPP